MIDSFFNSIDYTRTIIILIIGCFLVGNLAWILRRRGVKDGYTRKLNHFGLSITSIIILSPLPDNIKVPTAIMSSIGVIFIYSISALSTLTFFSSIMDSNVRERDAPKGQFYVFLPLITGQFATYTALLLLNPLYLQVAFCSMGLGDGLAEPVGLRFGKRKYSVRIPFINQVNTKSIEGSSAVFFVSIIAFVVFFWSANDTYSSLILMGFLYASIITVVEAISPRGTDNFLIISIGVITLYFFEMFI